MKNILTAALIVITAAPAVAGSDVRTVIATPAMNPRMDGVTPGVTPAGALAPNRAGPAKCETIAGSFRYPDGTVRQQAMTRCE